jgi:oxalate decarboxylase/phosphoglucose isomerase-like protein (cupin superfamily)
MCLEGTRTVAIGPPELFYEFPLVVNNGKSSINVDFLHDRTHQHRVVIVELKPGDAVIIPHHWIHQVSGPKGGLAMSASWQPVVV